MSALPAYAELHCLSSFSFLRGASRADELFARARALGYTALAITDECSLSGIVRAHEAAREQGLPLMVGTELRLQDGLKLVLLAPDHEAYTELCGLITRGRRAAAKGSYRLQRSDLEGAASHCLALWPAAADARLEDAQWLRARFAQAWIAVELLREAGDAARLAHLQALGAQAGLALVAAGDVHMHTRGRRALQDTLTAIRHRCSIEQAGQRLYANGERHLRTREELAALYPPELLAETVAIAARCRFSLDQLRYEYPHELVPAGLGASAHLQALTADGARRRWPQGTPPAVQAQLDKELALIAELRYEHFFLTVHDLVVYARGRGILCQGRGSAANSAVCYALGITEVDPARSSLLFERFLSRERNEPPDIDVDFEHQRREEVIQYVYAKYGRTRAALAATVICYRPRSALRDVGRALGFTVDQVDALSKSLAWWDSREELPQRLREQGFDPEAPLLRRLLALVNQLIGLPRHLSQHVGGFVISERPLSQLVPVENAAMPERSIIQWDKDDLETLGLLKVDCLALGMLSAIRRALALVTRWRGREFGMSDIPAEDADTYAMICRGQTVGVFQIESRAQMSMLPRLQPRRFYDLVIEVAIVRPGPIQGGMVHPYLRRRQGLEQVEYPSAALRAVLDRTLGVPLFQEQVMQIAVVAAGFTPGEADQLRRSMAAWKRKGGLSHLRERLLQGMAERGYPPEFAERIYQQILGFGEYGFPESHAASFALLAYVSAWLKCHQPAAFFAALLNSLPMGFYGPSQLVQEARRSGVDVRPVDATLSDWDCTLEPDARGAPALRLGLNRIAGFGEAAALALVAARAQRPFVGVDDLVRRAGLDRRARRALADAGALAALAGHRHAARWAVAGVEDLPGLLRGHSAAEPALALRAPREGEDLVADYRSLGLSLGRHPVALLRPRLRALRVRSAAELQALEDGTLLRVAGLVTTRQRPGTASGVLFMTLEDETGSHNLVVWAQVQDEHRQAILASRFLVVSGQLQKQQGVTHVVARRLHDRSRWLGELMLPSRDFH